jgi:hypothetical protein
MLAVVAAWGIHPMRDLIAIAADNLFVALIAIVFEVVTIGCDDREIAIDDHKGIRKDIDNLLARRLASHRILHLSNAPHCVVLLLCHVITRHDIAVILPALDRGVKEKNLIGSEAKEEKPYGGKSPRM